MFVTKNTSLICFTFSTASSPIGMSRATYIEAVPPLELLSQWREAMLTFCFCIISQQKAHRQTNLYNFTNCRNHTGTVFIH